MTAQEVFRVLRQMILTLTQRVSSLEGGTASGISQLTGDVTAGPGSGSQAATIAGDAVTNAKLANMAAHLIKARKTNSTGDPEDATLSEVLDFIGSAAQGDILYRAASDWARLGAGTSGYFLKTQGAAANPTWAQVTATGITGAKYTFGITVDAGSVDVSTGVKGFIPLPLSGTISKFTLLSTDPAATTGDLVVDVWKDVFANYPPDNSDSITGGNEPELSGDNAVEDSTLTSWSKTVTAGDIVGFNVDSCTGIKRFTLTIEVTT